MTEKNNGIDTSIPVDTLPTLLHMIVDIRGQSIWAKKSALERSETAS
jgi:hypothetical protein